MSDPAIGALLGEELGADGGLDLNAAWPKYKQIRYHTRRFALLVGWLERREWLQREFPAEREALAAYGAGLMSELKGEAANAPCLDSPAVQKKIQRALGADSEEAAQELLRLPPADDCDDERVQQFLQAYPKFLESDLVSTPISAYSALLRFTPSLETRERLCDRFLRRAEGQPVAPLPGLASADFRRFHACAGLSDKERQEILLWLHRLLSVTGDAYAAYSLPDVDVEEFIEGIRSALEAVKKSVPRCDEAFRRLESSLDLLRENFGRYYRDSKAAGSSSMLMESFVMDVASSNGGASASLRGQFKQIISYYRKQMSSAPRDSKARALFQKINASFSELERVQGESGGNAESDAEGEAAEEASAAAGAAPGAEDAKKQRKRRAAAKKRTLDSMDAFLGRPQQ